MARVDKLLTNFATSKVGQNLYKKAINPKNEKFINNSLPLIEAGFATVCSLSATQFNPKIKDEQKEAMQIQNLCRFGFTLFLAGSISAGVSKFTDNVVKNLKPELQKNGSKIADGIKVITPIISTTLISRYAVPVALVPLSSKIRDKINKGKNKKLDLNA